MNGIKLIVFDYDGTLFDCSMLHFEALNEALRAVNPKYVISFEDHVKEFDSLTTIDKLYILHRKRGLPVHTFSSIQNEKKRIFTSLVSSANLDTEHLTSTLRLLKSDGYHLDVASNADSLYVKTMLNRQGIIQFFDNIYTRDDCHHHKPHPQIYMLAMSKRGVKPSETLIIEDSLAGHRSAVASGAHLMVVESTHDVSYYNIIDRIRELKNDGSNDRSWFGSNINVVIPMAGAGARFVREGYPVPKPLIDVNGVPMVQAAIELIDLPNAKFTFIVQKEHNERYGLTHLLRAIKPGSNVVTVDGVTQGAACTVIEGIRAANIPDHEHLVISNCDQRIEMDWATYFNQIVKSNADASIVTFEEKEFSTKWSYASVDDRGWITSVKEKERISPYATCGIYHFRRTEDFVSAALEMIKNNDRVNNEFYVAPTYNYLIKKNMHVMNFKSDRMYGLGTPEDLRKYTGK